MQCSTTQQSTIQYQHNIQHFYQTYTHTPTLESTNTHRTHRVPTLPAWALHSSMLANIFALIVVLSMPSTALAWCSRGQACWPTAAEVSQLTSSLDPSAKRILDYAGPGSPRPCAVPVGSPGEQPLYGIGATQSLAPLYYNKSLADTSQCMHTGEKRLVCVAATRNAPKTPNTPQFVVFPLTGKWLMRSNSSRHLVGTISSFTEGGFKKLAI